MVFSYHGLQIHHVKKEETFSCCACDAVSMDYCNYLDGFKDNVFNGKKSHQIKYGVIPFNILCFHREDVQKENKFVITG